MASEPFEIATRGPVEFAWEDEPVAGYRFSARGVTTVLGETVMFSATGLARPDYETGVDHVEADAVITAADGDELYLRAVGYSPIPDIKSGEFAGELQFSIESGTGRFEGARGGGRLTAQGNTRRRPCIVESRLAGTFKAATRSALAA